MWLAGATTEDLAQTGSKKEQGQGNEWVGIRKQLRKSGSMEHSRKCKKE